MSIARDLVHPRRERVAILIAVPVFQHAEKYVLRQVFAELSIAGKPQEVTKEGTMMTFEQYSHFGQISIPNLLHEYVVGPRFRHSPNNTGARGKGYQEGELSKIGYIGRA